MRSCFPFLLLLCIIPAALHAQVQEEQYPTLHIGDPAPPLEIREWLKGDPVQHFEKGQIYVLEFWATWCTPCKAAIPRLSVLAEKYRDKVIILGIDVLEYKTTSISKVKAFVDSMGNRMNYRVAIENSNLMETGWLNVIGERGIPKTIVVNAEGHVAWIGHPKDLDEVLPDIIDNTWDIKQALAKRNLDRYLDSLDKEWAYYGMIEFEDHLLKPGDLGKPDAALLRINEILKNEPRLKFRYFVACKTFASLLKTNQRKAYEYGKEIMLLTGTYKETAFDVVVGGILTYSEKLKLSPKIYQLGAEAYQAKIDWFPYPELVNMHKYYNEMAVWHSLANDKSKAIDAQQKAIEALKSKNDYSVKDLAAFESRLQQYKNM